MPEQPTTPDLVELARRFYGLVERGDLDAADALVAPHAVLDMSLVGLGSYEGHTAIRGFLEDWLSPYEKLEMEPEEVLDLGNGVAFLAISQRARPVGSTGELQVRFAHVQKWVDGVIERLTGYPDIDAARAAAERIGAERG